MSQDNEKPINQLRLYSTAPHPCSYLEDEEACTLFIDPEADIDFPTLSYLNERGFRRSGEHIYKPNCLNCQACISYRVLIKGFKFSRNQRRIFKKNQDVNFVISSDISSEVHYQLYKQYIEERHKEGDMYPPSRQQYESFLGNPLGNTFYLEAYIGEKLIAVAVTDHCHNGLSSVYSFFDPSYENRSLGQLLIQQQIHMAGGAGFDYLYLGYWIKNSNKMNYKSRYKPAEIYLNKRWIALNDA